MTKKRQGEFERRKALLIGRLDRLAKIEPGCAKGAQAMMEKLEGGFFTLAIIGQVKRGKTTLANALLGEALLPVDALPLTSVITVVRHGGKERFEVAFQNGQRRQISANQIADYITEERNPKNAKGVESLEIGYPSHFLSLGVVLVDTPGIGSTFRHNTDMTQRFLPEVDAAIFVLSPDPPITEAECAFLAESARHASKFFFVLTKSDYLDAKELARVSEFDRGAIAERMELKASCVRLFSLSAKSALEAKEDGKAAYLAKSGLPQFESALEQFVAEGKGGLVLHSSESKIAFLAQDVLNQRLIEKQGLLSADSDLASKIAQFEREMERIAAMKENVEALIDSEQKKIMEVLDADLEELKGQAIKRISAEVLEHAKGLGKYSNQDFSAAIEDFRSEQVLAALESWRDSEEGKVSKEFSARMAKYSGSVDGIIGAIETVASGIFKVKIAGRKTGERLTLESDFYFKLSREGEDRESPGMELLLPSPMFRKIKTGKIGEEVLEDIDRNCGRMRYDFLSRLQKSSGEFKWALGAKIDSVIGGVRSASSRAAKTRGEGAAKTRERLARIETETAELVEIIGERGGRK